MNDEGEGGGQSIILFYFIFFLAWGETEGLTVTHSIKMRLFCACTWSKLSYWYITKTYIFPCNG